jgi:hypothetical protein
MSRRRQGRHGHQRQRGAAMVEFVIVIIPFLILSLGVIQLALIFTTRLAVKYAAGRAARAAVVVIPAAEESGHPGAVAMPPNTDGPPPLILVVKRHGKELDFKSFDGTLANDEQVLEYDRLPDKVFIGKKKEVDVNGTTVKSDKDGYVKKTDLQPLAKPFQVDEAFTPPSPSTDDFDESQQENASNPMLAIRKAAAFALLASAPSKPGEFVGEALYARGDLSDKEAYALQATGVVLTGGTHPKWNDPITVRVVYVYYCQIPLVSQYMCDDVDDLPDDAWADVESAGIQVPGEGRFIVLRAEQTLINQGRPAGGSL